MARSHDITGCCEQPAFMCQCEDEPGSELKVAVKQLEEQGERDLAELVQVMEERDLLKAAGNAMHDDLVLVFLGKGKPTSVYRWREVTGRD